MSRSATVVAIREYRKPCGACADCEVRRTAVCAALEDDEVVALERIMGSVRLEANAMLVEEGAPRRRVFSLTSGMLRLLTALPDGRRQITGFLLPGDYLGLLDEATHTLTAEAVVPSVLCGFPVPQMQDLMERYPRLKDRLHQMTKAALRQAWDNQLVLGRLAPVEKVSSFLLVLSARLASGRPVSDTVPLAMTRADIADYLGLTVETVSRSFTKLRQQGLIRLPDAHRVEIVDREALAAVAGMEPQSSGSSTPSTRR